MQKHPTNNRTKGNPRFKTTNMDNMTKVKRADLNERQFCTFDMGVGRGSGVVEAINGKTVRVSVIHSNGRSAISKASSLYFSGHGVKRHIEKHNVKLYPVGVIPIN